MPGQNPWEQDALAPPEAPSAALTPWKNDPIAASANVAREAAGPLEAIQAGWQGSAPGLAWRGKLPDLVTNPEHSRWWERALTGVTQVAAELPLMVAGSAVGAPAGAALGTAVSGPAAPAGAAIGSVLGAGAGMFMVPAALRETLMQAYKSGDISTATDFWNILREVATTTAKEGAIGAATMGAGGLAARAAGSALVPAIGTAVSVPTAIKAIGAADVAAQIATMTAMPAAFQGRLPDAQEVMDAAIVIGGLKAAHTIAGRIADVYAKTGKTPAEQVADAKEDPSIATDLIRAQNAERTGTASGVPYKLDRLIAQAQFLGTGGVNEADARTIIRNAAAEGRLAPQQNATALDATLARAEFDWQIPWAPDVKALIRDIKAQGPLQGDLLADVGRLEKIADEVGGKAETVVNPETHQAEIVTTPPRQLTAPERAELEGLRTRINAGLHTAEVSRETGLQSIYEDVRAKMRVAGRPVNEATAIATIERERYRARGARIGEDPADLYFKKPLQIRGEEPPAPETEGWMKLKPGPGLPGIKPPDTYQRADDVGTRTMTMRDGRVQADRSVGTYQVTDLDGRPTDIQVTRDHVTGKTTASRGIADQRDLTPMLDAGLSLSDALQRSFSTPDAPPPTRKVVEAPTKPVLRGLEDPAIADMVKTIGYEEAGWAQVGGKLLRSGEGASADEIAAGRAAEVGPVIGRTTWIPRADWWQGRPDKSMNEAKYRAAVDKALAGEKLSPAEQRAIDYLVDVANERMRAIDAIGSEEFDAIGRDLVAADEPPTTQSVLDANAVARVAAFDDGIVERLAAQYADDDVSFMRAIHEILQDLDAAEEAKRARGTTGAGGEVDTGEASGENGNPPLRYEQRLREDETRSPEFKAWFKGSKIKDDEGHPEVWYHGTAGDFNAFDVGRTSGSLPAVFLSRDPRFASNFAEERATQTTTDGGTAGANVMPVYVRAEHPFDSDKPADLAKFTAFAKSALGMTPRNADLLTQDVATGDWLVLEGDPRVREFLQTQGFDSAYVKEMGAKNLAVFSPEQVKSALGNAGTFNPNDANILYQTREGPRLSVLHNLSADNLEFAAKLGGLPVPSLAVTPENRGLSGMGEITMIGKAHLGDPRAEPIYDADVYSPTFPRAEYNKVRMAVAQKLIDRMRPFDIKFEDRIKDQTWDNAVNTPNPRDTISMLLRSNAAKAMYLDEKLGIKAEPVLRAKRKAFQWVKYLDWDKYNKEVPFNDERPMEERERGLIAAKGLIREAIERYLSEDREGKKLVKALGHEDALYTSAHTFGVSGKWIDEEGEMPYSLDWKLRESRDAIGKKEVDTGATTKTLDKKLSGHEADFTQWVNDLILPMYGEPFLRNQGKKPFTLSHIVDAMVGNVRAQEKSMTFGEGKARAFAAKRFADIEQMRRAAAEYILPEEEISAGRKKAKAALESWRNQVVEHYGNKASGSAEFGRVWEGFDASMKALARWARNGKTAANLRAALAAEGFDTKAMPEYLFEDGVEAGKLFLKAPVPYFEAKPQRAVDFNEFAGAVIPKKAPDTVREILTRQGIPFVEYDSSKDGEQQRAAVTFRNELAQRGENVLFQDPRQNAIAGSDQLRGAYTPAEHLVELFRAADKSTALHEIGHSWLEELKADAMSPNASDQLRADWETVRRELAIPANGEIGVASHEQWARSVERYVSEGKAPSTDLAGVFARFREWLMSLWREIRETPVEVSPDLRAVLDRMLATDDQIQAAQDLGVPRAYVDVAKAEAARKIVPGDVAKAAAEKPFADELPTGPGEAPDTSRVNYKYINSPTDLKLAMQRMAELDQAEIQRHRGGVEGVKSWALANAEQAQYLNDILGGGPDTLHLFAPRDPNAPQIDTRLGIMKKLVTGAAKESARLRDIVLEKAFDATVQEQLEYMGSLERLRMMQAEFLGERASVARALNALKDTTEGSGEINRMLEAIGTGAQRLFQRTPAEENAYLKAKLDEILLNYKGKSVLDIAKLHKEIGSLKGTVKLAKEASQATTWQKLVEGWKSGLLSGPVTHVTNLFGTGAFQVMRPAVDTLGALIGMARGAKVGMGENDRASLTEGVSRLTGYLGAVQDGLKVAVATFKADTTTGKTESYQNAIEGKKGDVIRIPLRLMAAEDAMVTTMYMRGELRTLAIRQAIAEGRDPRTREFAARVTQLVDNPTPEIQARAEAAGTRMTFNAELGEKGRTLQLFVNKWNLQWMIPFIRTPINISKELARLSPLAPVVGEWRAAIARGGVERDRAIAEVMIGSALMTAAAAAAFAGNLSGAGSPDQGKNRAKVGTWQPYSRLIGDTWYEYDRIQPVGTLIGIAADMANVWDHMTPEEMDKIPKMLAVAFANAVTNQTFLQGITNFVNATSDPTRFAPRFAQQFVSSAVPNVIGQPTAMADPVVREVNSMLEAVQARIPGARQQLLAKRDWLGEPVETKERLGVVSPVRQTKVSKDKVRTEADRLDISVAAPPKKTHLGKGTGKIGEVELTPEEQDKFEEMSGKMAHSILTNIVNAPGWDDLPPLIQRRIYTNVLTAAHRFGAAMALPVDKKVAYLQAITEKLQQELQPEQQ